MLLPDFYRWCWCLPPFSWSRQGLGLLVWLLISLPIPWTCGVLVHFRPPVSLRYVFCRRNQAESLAAVLGCSYLWKFSSFIGNFTSDYPLMMPFTCWCMCHHQSVADQMINSIFYTHSLEIITCWSLANSIKIMSAHLWNANLMVTGEKNLNSLDWIIANVLCINEQSDHIYNY